jgi:hypothetical protein
MFVVKSGIYEVSFVLILILIDKMMYLFYM